jgi:hypothetical protein
MVRARFRYCGFTRDPTTLIRAQRYAVQYNNFNLHLDQISHFPFPFSSFSFTLVVILECSLRRTGNEWQPLHLDMFTKAKPLCEILLCGGLLFLLRHQKTLDEKAEPWHFLRLTDYRGLYPFSTLQLQRWIFLRTRGSKHKNREECCQGHLIATRVVRSGVRRVQHKSSYSIPRIKLWASSSRP